MKKIIAIALTLMMLCGAVTAFADTELVTPSKTTEDLTTIESTVENPVAGKTVTVAAAEDQTVAEAELEKAAAAGTVEAYFGEEATKAIQAILGEGAEISLDEFMVVTVEGYADEMGNVTVTAKFPTAYAEGEKVAVLIGTFDAEKNLTWNVVEGVGQKDGSVQYVVDAATMALIQNGEALVAVCSK